MKTFSQFLTESEKIRVHVSMSKKLNETEKKEFDRVLNYYDAKVSSETDKGVVVQFTTSLDKKAFSSYIRNNVVLRDVMFVDE